MKTFSCSHCGHVAYFDNSLCVQCERRLAYRPEAFAMIALAPGDDEAMCANAAHDACNWLTSGSGSGRLCRACRHNLTIPDISQPDNLTRWRVIETAKRHLFYSLTRWGLPLPDRKEDPEAGLAFEFLADTELPDGTVEPAMTGHANGLITIAIAEGDDAERERRRLLMGEPYRTLLGHFRHEIGHFYWDRLVRDAGRAEAFRTLFGDERDDYGSALKRHHAQGALADWPERFISAYASAHPWEDFAETFAHYVHMADTLETAGAFGMRVDQSGGLASDGLYDPYRRHDAREMTSAWIPLTVAINAVNRSMGQPDLYPFIISEPVIEKLQFVSDLISQSRRDY